MREEEDSATGKRAWVTQRSKGYPMTKGTRRSQTALAWVNRRAGPWSYLGDGEVISTWAGIEICLRVLIMLEVLYFYLVMKHCHGQWGSPKGSCPGSPRPARESNFTGAGLGSASTRTFIKNLRMFGTVLSDNSFMYIISFNCRWGNEDYWELSDFTSKNFSLFPFCSFVFRVPFLPLWLFKPWTLILTTGALSLSLNIYLAFPES